MDNNEQKKPKSVLVFQIISAALGAVGISCIISIFTGRLNLPGSSGIIYLERTEAIITCAVLLVLAGLFLFLSILISSKSKNNKLEGQ